ncbi:MAG: DUF362 domain-containing protein [Proteobacteria bacterium]|nr:DUF362 domain-containing protein [Pseudomonadota bacterium]
MNKLTRRTFIGGGLAVVGTVAFVLRKKLKSKLTRWTRSAAFTATPPLRAHDPATERRTVHVAKGGTVEANVDQVLDKAGVDKLVGVDDLVILKISAQWWNQGMSNVAAVKRTIERILARPGFTGEIVVFENTHFRLANGSGLSRAFSRDSARNVDVPGWTKLGDLVDHFDKSGAPVSFVGLVDAAPSELADDHWHDAPHAHGVYGGDGRGPIKPGEVRDGMRWDFERAYALKRGWFEETRTPLSWPVFTSPRSGLQIDFADGIFKVEGDKRTKVDRKLTWISMVTVNEHSATGMTACCKSAMGIVDMSAGRFGTDPRTEGYNSIHYFGNPEATWRMAGPLAHFATHVRSPDLYLAVAEWVAISPPASAAWDDDRADIRLDEATAHRANTVVAGDDAVAVDWVCAKQVLMPIAQRIDGRYKAQLDVTDPDSKLSKFLRYYREVARKGTMDDALIDVA